MTLHAIEAYDQRGTQWTTERHATPRQACWSSSGGGATSLLLRRPCACLSPSTAWCWRSSSTQARPPTTSAPRRRGCMASRRGVWRCHGGASGCLRACRWPRHGWRGGPSCGRRRASRVRVNARRERLSSSSLRRSSRRCLRPSERRRRCSRCMASARTQRSDAATSPTRGGASRFRAAGEPRRRRRRRRPRRGLPPQPRGLGIDWSRPHQRRAATRRRMRRQPATRRRRCIRPAWRRRRRRPPRRSGKQRRPPGARRRGARSSPRPPRSLRCGS
mmetsp:Transcript_41443/g.130265  ORF Transcript_41443/g.130265 Transcript_41443/m.130265 type:complete len:275 (-) Transcript_41443:631-1455(-)